MPQYQLVVRRGPRAGETFELKSQTVIIGRDSTADIIINDPEVSRNHCRLILDRSYYLQDLGSTNGTFIDGQRLGGEPVRLANGQILQLGSNVTLLHQEVETSNEVASTIAKPTDEMNTGSAVPNSFTPSISASPTIPERDDQLPSFDDAAPAGMAESPQMSPAIDQGPAQYEPAAADYNEPEPAKKSFFNSDSSPDLGAAPPGAGPPWANWTQTQWMIALAVLLVLLLCACCIFLVALAFIFRPELFGSAAGLSLLLN